jgi:hypothetical protein
MKKILFLLALLLVPMSALSQTTSDQYKNIKLAWTPPDVCDLQLHRDAAGEYGMRERLPGEVHAAQWHWWHIGDRAAMHGDCDHELHRAWLELSVVAGWVPL